MAEKMTYTEVMEARKLRQEHKSYQQIAVRLNRDPETIRRALDKTWAEHRNRQIRKARYRKGAVLDKAKARPPKRGYRYAVAIDATRALFDPARDEMPVLSDLTAVLMGDPPPGRRELLLYGTESEAE